MVHHHHHVRRLRSRVIRWWRWTCSPITLELRNLTVYAIAGGVIGGTLAYLLSADVPAATAAVGAAWFIVFGLKM
ncbi:hypothetical protein A4U49_08170 [Acidithiobacillus ferrivorans]|uniref:hypothetical protein n=1 Tax=Acidithiobacillus ferrivorans TaxID=160808 RepID=UPI000892FB98|nr:hypothetical protein [Acidithiobacillus ferrivorans]OFA16302.1 hypothetical protein A4U49_08170 [Acidithiobacillus ferrivorans]